MNLSNKQEYLSFKGKIIVDFYTDACMPCKVLKNIFEKVASKNPNIRFAKCDVVANKEVAVEENITYVPHIKFYENGVFKGETIDEKQLQEKIDLYYK